MSDHSETHASAVAHDGGHDIADPRLQLAASMKFEPIELQDFQIADKAAGQMMGKLLGFLFCVLITLMTGVNIWMMNHQAQGNDPQAPIVVESAAGHH